MSAIRKLAAEAADNGLLAPELATGISRVKSVKSTGIRVGNWLSQRQAQETPGRTRVLNRARPARSCDSRRPTRVLPPAFRSCGTNLRACSTTRRTLVYCRSSWKARACSNRADADVGENRDRRVDLRCRGRSGSRVSSCEPRGRGYRGTPGRESSLGMLRQYAAEVGVPGIAPHDLRRTCAKLCRAAGGELEQIQMLLGTPLFRRPSVI
jgi:hypothetical protein